MCNSLLDEERMVQPEAVGELANNDGVIVDIGAGEGGVEGAILVFEFVAERGLGPVAGNVVALVVQAGPVDVCVKSKTVTSQPRSGTVSSLRVRWLYSNAVARCCQCAEVATVSSALARRLF